MNFEFIFKSIVSFIFNFIFPKNIKCVLKYSLSLILSKNVTCNTINRVSVRQFKEDTVSCLVSPQVYKIVSFLSLIQKIITLFAPSCKEKKIVFILLCIKKITCIIKVHLLLSLIAPDF